jgi:hypothetical protein
VANSRDPGAEIKSILRKEVGYGCPVKDCGSPFLEWHHFDPPWEPEHIHRVEGIIALCRDHHPAADGGSFTNEQLHHLKKNPYYNRVRGKLLWMRNKVFVAAGTNYFMETPIILNIKGRPAIYFNRDDSGSLLLNLKLFDRNFNTRFAMEDNFFNVIEQPVHMECPPAGDLVYIRFADGDMIRIEFFAVHNFARFKRLYPSSWLTGDRMCSTPQGGQKFEDTFPLVMLDIIYKCQQHGVDLNSRTGKVPYGIIRRSFVSNTGIAFGV